MMESKSGRMSRSGVTTIWRFFRSFIGVMFNFASATCVLHLGLKSGLKCCYGPNSDVVKRIFTVIFGDQVLIKLEVRFFVNLMTYVLMKILWKYLWPSPGWNARRYLQDQQELYGICPPDQFLSRRLRILSHYFCTFRIHVCVILLRFPPWQQMR